MSVAGRTTDGRIEAIDIAEAAINASKLNVRQIIVTDLIITDNSPAAGRIAWSACTVYYDGVSYAIASGNAASSAEIYVSWTVGAGTFAAAALFTPADNIFLIATNNEGTADIAWNKLANIGVQRTNLGFGLLEGYHIEDAVVQAINMSSTSTVTLINESTEGVLLQIGAMYASADSALQYRAKFRITVDGGSSTDYPVFFGDTATLEFAFEAKTECTNITAIGTLSPGDSYSHYIGVTYKTSLLVEWVPTVTGSSGQVSVKVRRALKV